jgi:hypothetical protein
VLNPTLRLLALAISPVSARTEPRRMEAEEAAVARVLRVVDEVVHAKARLRAERHPRVVAEGEHGLGGARRFPPGRRDTRCRRRPGGGAGRRRRRRRCRPCALTTLALALHGVGPRVCWICGRLRAAVARAQAGVEVGAADADGGRLGLDARGVGGALGDQAGDGAEAAAHHLHQHAVAVRGFRFELVLLQHELGVRPDRHAGAVGQPDDRGAAVGGGQAVAFLQGQAAAQRAGGFAGALGEADAAGELDFTGRLREDGTRQEDGGSQRCKPLECEFSGAHVVPPATGGGAGILDFALIPGRDGTDPMEGSCTHIVRDLHATAFQGDRGASAISSCSTAASLSSTACKRTGSAGRWGWAHTAPGKVAVPGEAADHVPVQVRHRIAQRSQVDLVRLQVAQQGLLHADQHVHALGPLGGRQVGELPDVRLPHQPVEGREAGLLRMDDAPARRLHHHPAAGRVAEGAAGHTSTRSMPPSFAAFT